MRTNIVRWDRVAGLAVASVAASATTSGVQDQAGRQTSPGADRQVASVRPICGTRPLPDLELAVEAARVAEFKRTRGSLKASTLTTITTYVLVLHNGSEGLLSERMIRDQIAVFNQAYPVHGFRFEMAPSARGNPNPDYSDNAVWFNDDELAYKTALKEGSGDDLNIYINSGAGFLGYAYYPTIVGTQSEVLDGLVLAYGTLPGAQQPGISDIPGFVYNFGDTAVHEVGTTWVSRTRSTAPARRSTMASATLRRSGRRISSARSGAIRARMATAPWSSTRSTTSWTTATISVSSSSPSGRPTA